MTFLPTLSDLSQRRNQTCPKGKQGSCLKILPEIQGFAEQLCGEVTAQVEVDNTGSLNFKSQVSKTPGKEQPYRGIVKEKLLQYTTISLQT